MNSIYYAKLSIDYKNYEVLKIGMYPFQISRYYVSGAIKLFSGKSKEIKLTILAESEDEATTIFKRIIENWNGLVSHEILKIIHA